MGIKIKPIDKDKLLRDPHFNLYRWRKKGVCVIWNRIEYNLEDIVKKHGLDIALEHIEGVFEQEFPKQVYDDTNDVRAYLMSKYKYDDIFYHQ